MDEEKKIEESANTFLKSFFDTTYNDNKMLFDNMQNIYALISFLYNNMQYLDVETQDLRTSTRKDYVAKSKLINDFYKNIGINFVMNDIERDGTLNILNTNTPSEATHNQIYFGNNNYVITEEFYIDPKTKEKIITYRAFHKTINVYNRHY